jgi:hypothetical protein
LEKELNQLGKPRGYGELGKVWKNGGQLSGEKLEITKRNEQITSSQRKIR